MAYATMTDVNAYLGKTPVTTTSKPTSTQAATLLAGVDGELNVRLATVGLVTPFVSDSSAVQDQFAAWLLAVECWGTAATILRDLLPAQAGPNGGTLWGFYEKKYQEALKGILDLSLVPVALGPVKQTAEPASYGTRFPDEPPEDGVNAEPIFNTRDSGPGSVRF